MADDSWTGQEAGRQPLAHNSTRLGSAESRLGGALVSYTVAHEAANEATSIIYAVTKLSRAAHFRPTGTRLDWIGLGSLGVTSPRMRTCTRRGSTYGVSRPRAHPNLAEFALNFAGRFKSVH